MGKILINFPFFNHQEFKFWLKDEKFSWLSKVYDKELVEIQAWCFGDEISNYSALYGMQPPNINHLRTNFVVNPLLLSKKITIIGLDDYYLAQYKFGQKILAQNLMSACLSAQKILFDNDLVIIDANSPNYWFCGYESPEYFEYLEILNKQCQLFSKMPRLQWGLIAPFALSDKFKSNVFNCFYLSDYIAQKFFGKIEVKIIPQSYHPQIPEIFGNIALLKINSPELDTELIQVMMSAENFTKQAVIITDSPEFAHLQDFDVMVIGRANLIFGQNYHKRDVNWHENIKIFGGGHENCAVSGYISDKNIPQYISLDKFMAIFLT